MTHLFPVTTIKLVQSIITELNNRLVYRVDVLLVNICIVYMNNFTPYTSVTHHVLNREQGVDVQGIPPPVVGTADVICSGWLKYRVIVEPLHCYLHYAKHKQVRHSEPATWRPNTVPECERDHALCRQLNEVVQCWNVRWSVECADN